MSDKSEAKRGMPAAPTPTAFIDGRRRGFLQGAVLAGGAVAGGTALADYDAGHDEVVGTEAPAPSGYRETDHVREYYAKARF